VEGGYLYYNRKPVQASAYIQDKIELFKSIILNLGLRWDYFDPKSQYNSNLSQELLLQDTIFLQKNLKESDPKHMIAPRISVSYPITDAGTIRFSYGHFYQIGSLATLYRNPLYRAPLGTNPSFGNPNVNPQRGVQYELGMQQGLTEDLKFDLTAYYKDVRDYIFSQTVLTSNGDKQYSVLTNLNYANTRGVSLSFVKRRSPGDLLAATLDYTFQIAEAMRTEPTEEMFFSEQSGKNTETYLVPLSFDRSHTITSTISLGEANNWNVSMLGYIRAGTPYTPAFPSSISTIQFTQNSDRQPMQWNVDMKAEKFFKVFGVDYSVFIQVDNLFDTENELYVYASSGRALTNIEQTYNATLFTDIRRRIARGDIGMIPVSSIDNYYAYAGAISSPRLVRLGISMNF
jgi:outer membrane receptor protein involved in Fe transport